jgi:hypothetical protein
MKALSDIAGKIEATINNAQRMPLNRFMIEFEDRLAEYI